MTRPIYIGTRAGFVVLEIDGELVAESTEGDRTPIAPVVSVGRHELTVECPFCPPTQSGQPRRHRHGRGAGPADGIGEGLKSSHCVNTSSRPYVVLLLDAERVGITNTP